MRDAATHEEIAAKLKAASQSDPMKTFSPAEGSDPTVVNQPEDFVASSDIICFGGAATFVPKRAIIQAPEKFASRLAMVEGATILTWNDFYAANRGWITTVEVSRAQAEGNEPIADNLREQYVKSGNLVVATYKGGPISVLPPKPSELPAAAAKP
jgi:hypothetical protein